MTAPTLDSGGQPVPVPAPFRLGVSLHSFTNEYVSYIWSFDDLLERTSLLGGGVEIVGPAHHRGFPEVSDEFERAFKSSVERYGLTPTSYGSYADPFMLPERDLNDEELVAYTLPQLRGAKKLGFPVVRLQHFAAEIVDRLLPLAEKLDLKLGYELHVPMTIESARTQFLLSQVEHYASPHLGLIPDAGIFARSIALRHRQEGLEMGVPEQFVLQAVNLWNDGVSLDDALHTLLTAGSPTAPTTTWVGAVWDTFGHSDPAALGDIIDHVVHVHGKFFSIIDGDEPDLRYAELVGALIRNDYRGWISSEYEGDAADSFAVVKAHQEMIARHVLNYRRQSASGAPRAETR